MERQNANHQNGVNWHLEPGQTQRVRAWLKAIGMTAYELAQGLNCHETAMSRILNGDRPFGPDRRLRFIERFGADTYTELFGTIPESPEVKLYELTKGANDDKCTPGSASKR
jgi:transcriptional regulator with XRE-family HTH domain